MKTELNCEVVKCALMWGIFQYGSSTVWGCCLGGRLFDFFFFFPVTSLTNNLCIFFFRVDCRESSPELLSSPVLRVLSSLCPSLMHHFKEHQGNPFLSLSLSLIWHLCRGISCIHMCNTHPHRAHAVESHWHAGRGARDETRICTFTPAHPRSCAAP